MSPSHYFDDDPKVASAPVTIDINLPDVSLSLTSDRGVFSADHLDPGTKLLLLEAPPLTPADETVLDVGCGWGPIACVVAHRQTAATIWAVDVNARARTLTAGNAQALGLADRIKVMAPSVVPEDLRFDRILSNPPIRIGKSALHELLHHWLSRLKPTGRAHLVVHRHLGSDSLAKWLSENGYPTKRISSRAGFRILEVRPRGYVSS